MRDWWRPGRFASMGEHVQTCSAGSVWTVMGSCGTHLRLAHVGVRRAVSYFGLPIERSIWSRGTVKKTTPPTNSRDVRCRYRGTPDLWIRGVLTSVGSMDGERGAHRSLEEIL